MSENTEPTPNESQSSVRCTALLGVIRNNRQIVIDAVGNELDRLHKEQDRCIKLMAILLEVRAELYRDKDQTPNDPKQPS